MTTTEHTFSPEQVAAGFTVKVYKSSVSPNYDGWSVVRPDGVLYQRYYREEVARDNAARLNALLKGE